MVDPIRLALNQQFLINLAAIAFIVIFTEIAAATIADQTKLFSEQNEGIHRFHFVFAFVFLYFFQFICCLLLGAWKKIGFGSEMGMKFSSKCSE